MDESTIKHLETEYMNLRKERDRELDRDTKGWIQFMPESGKKAMNEGNYRFTAIDTWRPAGNLPVFNDERAFEKYVSDNMDQNEYKTDMFEGRCVNSSFPTCTEFASCYTIIRAEDIDPKTKRLTEKKKAQLLKYKTDPKYTCFNCVKAEKIPQFRDHLNDGFLKKLSDMGYYKISTSEIFVRAILYLSPMDYYRFGIMAENISDIRNGMPTVGNDDVHKFINFNYAGLIGICTKLNHFEGQTEGRLGITFHKSIGCRYLKIHSLLPLEKQDYCIHPISDIDSITF